MGRTLPSPQRSAGAEKCNRSCGLSDGNLLHEGSCPPGVSQPSSLAQSSSA